MNTITSTLVDFDGQLVAEYENEDGSTYVRVDVDRNDFNDFAEVEIDNWCIVRADRDDEDLRADYNDWFDSVDEMRTEYAKTLPAYCLFLQMVQAMDEHKKANELV
jgi:hypothetical protein